MLPGFGLRAAGAHGEGQVRFSGRDANEGRGTSSAAVRGRRVCAVESSSELQVAAGNPTTGRVFRGTETRTGENLQKTEIHQQDRPQQTGHRPLSERDTGEDLVSEPQDEVEELQREGEHVHTTADGATDALEPV
ncbi:hypothetical protein ROHU_009741 [Labeo rohita]|uniref:Uncharacterized protein n=1 Tax=Labeo rohita TaxID=84645 RepID=A0A498M6X9_LABRO|nr:hypothetical protein ROHU_009741 [Labeo rohita]